MFKKNMGKTDRTIRIAVGALLIALALFGQIGWWGFIGILPIATGLMSSCVLYTLFGIDTRGKF